MRYLVWVRVLILLIFASILAFFDYHWTNDLTCLIYLLCWLILSVIISLDWKKKDSQSYGLKKDLYYLFGFFITSLVLKMSIDTPGFKQMIILLSVALLILLLVFYMVRIAENTD